MVGRTHRASQPSTRSESSRRCLGPSTCDRNGRSELLPCSGAARPERAGFSNSNPSRPSDTSPLPTLCDGCDRSVKALTACPPTALPLTAGSSSVPVDPTSLGRPASFDPDSLAVPVAGCPEIAAPVNVMLGPLPVGPPISIFLRSSPSVVKGPDTPASMGVALELSGPLQPLPAGPDLPAPTGVALSDVACPVLVGPAIGSPELTGSLPPLPTLAPGVGGPVSMIGSPEQPGPSSVRGPPPPVPFPISPLSFQPPRSIRRSSRLASKNRGICKSSIQRAQDLLSSKLKSATSSFRMAEPSTPPPEAPPAELLDQAETAAPPALLNAAALYSTPQNQPSRPEKIPPLSRDHSLPLSVHEVNDILASCGILFKDSGPSKEIAALQLRGVGISNPAPNRF
ncbi:leucine-rich repeat extensin-like protein 5 [Ananas comosus]|uniref:Leucine-rich repeat extensin-like protein 5 n=1 Tax=Ananas comosus TaxID=4615 RepID=A0A6P5FG95_ANACO|nr:leucine-rich repeat extensin-like protein 5 [Ananas comosus]